MAKEVLFHDEARNKMFKGVEKLANAVRATMGPKGRNVVLQRQFGSPLITNDGVTIARDISFEDPFEDLGAQLVKEASIKTNDTAGDGTSCSTLLSYAIVKEGLRVVASGANPMVLKSGIEKATDIVVDELARVSKDVTTKEEIAQVATISAQSKEVGEVIADIFEVVGRDGVVTVEDGNTIGISKRVVEGVQVDQGYISPYMVTDTTRLESVYTDVSVLVTDHRISTTQDILPILEKVAASGKKELVMFVDDMDAAVLNMLVVNSIRGAFKSLVIKAPGFGDRKKEMLKDIAAVVGAVMISKDMSMKIDQADISDLGFAKKVIADKSNTTIVASSDTKEDIEDRVKLIKAQAESTTNEFEREQLVDRASKLSGGVGVIEVGAATELELKDKKLRIEDALAATRAAIDEGIVAGGGTALLRASKLLEDVETTEHDEKVGIDIVRKALEYPASQIAENAGKSGAVIVRDVKNQEDNNYGYDAVGDEICDLVERGIIDPTKVARSALQNAASIAAMFLTTEVAVTEIPKKDVDTGNQMRMM